MISTLLTVGSFVVGASGAFVAVYTLRSTKRQTDATTGKITSESGKIQAETAFVGSQYIRDLSEASVALALRSRVVPRRNIVPSVGLIAVITGGIPGAGLTVTVRFVECPTAPLLSVAVALKV